MKNALGWHLGCLAFIVVGWMLSGYLLLRTLLLASGGAVSPDVCSVVVGGGCDTTLLSPDSWQLGVPVAGWGFIYFAVLGVLVALGSGRLLFLSLLLTAVGVGVSLFLALNLARSPASTCYLCLLVHAVNVVLLFAETRMIRALQGNSVAELSLRSRRFRWQIGGACLLGFMAQAVLWSLPASIDSQGVLAAYLSEPRHVIPIEPDNASRGPVDAPVRLLVFSSFQCPGCRTFAASQRLLEDRFGDRIRISFRHFPLERECNPAVNVDLQPRACEAAWASEEARNQGVFWRYHDKLFASDLKGNEGTLLGIAKAVVPDVAKWQAQRKSQQVMDEVASNVDLGNRLGVTETPSVFLNGRRVRPFNLAILVFLIEYELARSDELKPTGPRSFKSSGTLLKSKSQLPVLSEAKPFRLDNLQRLTRVSNSRWCPRPLAVQGDRS